jgi:S1-C subfamily serine protease
VPGQTKLRREVQASEILKRLNAEFPPQRLMDALGRVDPFGSITGPEARVGPPDPELLDDPGVRLARNSVVRVTGTACGLGIEGSGWIIRPGLVVTNAHVVAGVDDARVDRADGDFHHVDVIAFDTHDDIAVLRVDGLGGRALRLAEPEAGRAVAILGYPENGDFTAVPGRIGQTARVLTEDAYGRRPVTRVVTTLRGLVRHGNSGGPAVDSAGRVRTTIFASRVDSSDGYGVPPGQVREALAEAAAGTEVSTGDCVR